MASKYRRQSTSHPSIYISSSEPESKSEESEVVIEELTQREYNDHRLTQAVTYLNEEGGDDSPELFMDRVNHIDKDLLLKLRNPGRDYDPDLYHDVWALVHEYQREFNEEMLKLAGQVEESDKSLPDYSTPNALHRSEEGEPGPSSQRPSAPKPSRPPPPQPPPPPPRRSNSEEKVQLERHFKYGGPKNEPEHWHKKFPASLPFPETLQLAHWESLQIDADLARGAKGESGGPEVVVSFNHPQLEQYKHLDQYDSGSRFKLPLSDTDEIEFINGVMSMDRLEKVADAINEGELNKENKQKYVPRVFLEKLEVGRQLSPTAIRRAINTSPSTVRQQSQASISSLVTPLGNITRELFDGNDATNTLKTPEESISTESTPPSPIPQPQTHRASPVARRISAHRANALRNASRQESLPSAKEFRRESLPTPKKSPKTTTRRVVKEIAIPAPKKRGPGRPREIVPTEAAKPTSTPTSRKRKRSEGSQHYTPDGKRRSVGQETYAPLTKSLRSTSVAKRRSKAVHWSSESEEEARFVPELPGLVLVMKAVEKEGGKAKVAAKKAAVKKTGVKKATAKKAAVKKTAAKKKAAPKVQEAVEPVVEKMQTRSGSVLH